MLFGRKKWFKNAIVYQIYPLSFKDSNGDGVGDLQGVIDKLDYLNDGTSKSLGVNAIWLSPVYRSPLADFGYDIIDHCNIDPIFGDLKIFDKLIFEAHKRGIKIIMDFVPNHTSDQHPWFVESRSAPDNPKRDWYVWRDSKENGTPPNNWQSIFGGSAWTYDDKTNQYYLHQFYSRQPDLNFRNTEVINEIKKILRFWLDRGVDGFRVDAIYHLFEQESFGDEKYFSPGISNGQRVRVPIHSETQGQPENIELLRAMCGVVGSYKNRIIVSEVYADLSKVLRFYKPGEYFEFNMPFNFSLMALKFEAHSFSESVNYFFDKLHKYNIPNFVLGNHDNIRIATKFGEKQARIMTMLVLTLGGVSFLYYGDEIGLKNTDIPADYPLSKVFNNSDRTPGDFRNDIRFCGRTPMHWSTNINSGFTNGHPWLPVGTDFETRNVEIETSNSKSVLNFYKKLIYLKQHNFFLKYGKYVYIKNKEKDLYIYKRKTFFGSITVILNFSSKEIIFPKDFVGKKINMSTHMDIEKGTRVKIGRVIRPFEGFILY